jgi:PAS domain S-box-containing protein
MEHTISILHLEDNQVDSKLVQSLLEKANVKFKYLLAEDEKDFLFHLEKRDTDIIISDYNLPGYPGTEALLYIKNNYPQIPFLFLSGTIGEDAAIETLLNGATDYVLKNKMERLVPAVKRAYKEAQELKARLKVENELRKISRVVEQSPNSVIIMDTKGTIEYVNPTTNNLSGYKSEELIGKNYSIFSSANNTEEEYLLLWKKLNAGKVCEDEFHSKKKNGELYWEAVSFSPILDADGTITNFLAIKEDITKRKELTQNLIIAKEKAEENDRLKTAFLHNISHEIRTPLNAIMGFSEFINDPYLGSVKRQQFTNIIVQNCDKLLSIISNILSIATIEAGQENITTNEVALNPTLWYLHEQFLPDATRKNISLNMKPTLSDNEDRIISDESKLVEILFNLISNALKFTKKGHINFGYTVNADDLEFFVEDTGIGISADMHEEIFKRFRQVESTIAHQSAGSGLGLSISKAYVELLGGKMWITSEVDKGSTFHFTIPFIKATNNTSKAKQSNFGIINELKEPKTLLVAEDEDSNFILLEEILVSLNITIIRAITGVQAVEICKSKHVDAILMDIKMPVMDGYEATKIIREFMPDLPIIAQTAYATNKDKNYAMACGCNGFLSKPFKKGLLISIVKEHLYKTEKAHPLPAKG